MQDPHPGSLAPCKALSEGVSVCLSPVPPAGWGDQLIWTQTYEEALFRSKHRYLPRRAHPEPPMPPPLLTRALLFQPETPDDHPPLGRLPTQPR